MRPVLVAVLLLLFSTFAFVAPATADDYVRYLLPTVGLNAPGANGSLWTTELTVHNPRDHEMTVIADICNPPIILQPPCTPTVTIPPQTSRAIRVYANALGIFGDGAFLYVPQDLNSGPTPMTLRVRDLSKSATSFGTEVPIARLTDFAQLIIITDIPTDPKYRATLRVYNSSEAPRLVRMRVYTLEGHTPIEERAILLSGINILVVDPTPLHPGYAQIDPLTPAVRAAAQRVRIEIEDPLRVIVSPPPPPIWALVSITNNDTQQVTTITPHP